VRAVIDTNVLVPAIWRGSAQGPVLDAWYRAEFELIMSDRLLNEIDSVFEYPHIQRRRGWSVERKRILLEVFRQRSVLVEPRIELNVVRDTDDNRVLEAAVTGEADYVVTLDDDLLTLHEFQGIQIVTPPRFLAILAEQRL
jgi:putative PIN family toxin of toxin-antitoxin system